MNPQSIQARLQSFRYAFNGLKTLIREEPNARIHLVAATGVIILGFLLKITPFEWIAILLAIGFVFAMELVNTALENLCDFVSPEKHELIKKIKDLSAASVLVSAVVAIIIGVLVFT
jgi:diacylglycerol kinase